MKWHYTTVHFDSMTFLGLSCIEYIISDITYHRSTAGAQWWDYSPEDLGVILGVNVKTVRDAVLRCVEKGTINKDGKSIISCQKFIDVVYPTDGRNTRQDGRNTREATEETPALYNYIGKKNEGVPADGRRVEVEPIFRGEGYEEEARTKGAPKNTKEMLAGYEIFTDQPARKTWKLREIERESMKILLEEYGHEKLVKRYAAVKAHRHDQFCPLIKSPSTFLQLMPNLERFIKNLEQ